MAFTREEVDAIEVGKTGIAFALDGRFGTPMQVDEITCKREVDGKLVVRGYSRLSNTTAVVAFTIKEGDELNARYYKIWY